MSNIPHEFTCPITFDIMVDPVICSDGYTYEKQSILKLINSISPITRQQIDKNNLIPNRNLKDAIERYNLQKVEVNQKISYMSKLEKFELEQKNKKKELEDKIKKELIEKQKRDYNETIKKQQEKEQENKLYRFLEMINSQNTELFNYGNFSVLNAGWNQDSWKNYSYTECGKKKYIFTIEKLKLIKNENKDILLKNIDNITNDYIWIKKYVICKGSNPLIEFVFDEFIPTIDDIIDKETQIIKNKTVDITNAQRCSPAVDYSRSVLQKDASQQNIELITRIKNKKLQSKEYYIVNYKEFIKDFEIIESVNVSRLNFKLNLLNYWIEYKQQKFNSLIENILSIINKNNDSINYISYTESTSGCHGEWGTNNTINLHILDMYKKVIQYYVQPQIVNRQNSFDDIISDYKPEYFQPILNLTENIIELTEFLQNL